MNAPIPASCTYCPRDCICGVAGEIAINISSLEYLIALQKHKIYRRSPWWHRPWGQRLKPVRLKFNSNGTLHKLKPVPQKQKHTLIAASHHWHRADSRAKHDGAHSPSPAGVIFIE